MSLMPKQISSGQIYVGECLTSHEPGIEYTYIILSGIVKEGIRWWSVASFRYIGRGASVFEFVDEEIEKLTFIGLVRENKSILPNIIRRIKQQLRGRRNEEHCSIK